MGLGLLLDLRRLPLYLALLLDLRRMWQGHRDRCRRGGNRHPCCQQGHPHRRSPLLRHKGADPGDWASADPGDWAGADPGGAATSAFGPYICCESSAWKSPYGPALPCLWLQRDARIVWVPMLRLALPLSLGDAGESHVHGPLGQNPPLPVSSGFLPAEAPSAFKVTVHFLRPSLPGSWLRVPHLGAPEVFQPHSRFSGLGTLERSPG